MSVGLSVRFCVSQPRRLRAQQGTADIVGRVADEQGAVLPGVAIVATNEATGVFREAVSGPAGTYSLSQLAPGTYRIVAKLAGFRTSERRGLILQVGTTMTINLSLAVGGLEETVTVTGLSPLVDTTSARVGGNVGTAELSELPAMNRNYFAAVALLPGVQFTPSNQMGNDTVTASGQSQQGNNVTVDGGYNADDALGATAGAQVRTPIEAIQEFQVMTSMYDAEYGRASGVVVNAVTKSGTNQFKGVAFLSAASNALTSKDFLVKQGNLTKPTSTKRDWGGVLGGPVVQEQGALLRQPRAAGGQPDPDAGVSNAASRSTSQRPSSARAGTRWSASTTRSTRRTPGRPGT